MRRWVLHEDEAPRRSPRGGRLTDFSNGRGTYADGWVAYGQGRWLNPSRKRTRNGPR